jgi:mannose-1-phosphate guanylyltransferase/mannose-6-phosphate isomerase
MSVASKVALKTTVKVTPVILSGGSGTRLWPLSRKQYPKQLLNLTGGKYTMLQQTLLRVLHCQPPIVVCNEDHRFMVAEQCHSIGIIPAAILLEPVGRNTAPAIALAALQAIKENEEAIIAVFPADHVIADQTAFEQALNTAITAAEQNKLVTFGIVADKPETGFGYIKSAPSAAAYYQVEKFVEKPDLATAEQYIASGDYYWNSGMFVFKASVYLAALETANVDIIRCCQESLDKAQTDLDFIRVDKVSFEQCPDDSIDYAIMDTSRENSARNSTGSTDNVVVVPMDAKWSDVGSWSALWDISNKDKHDNAHMGEVISINSKNNLVHSKDKLVATIGLENIVIVETNDALLVADQDHVQDVKKSCGTT